jgi:VanZ family protein
VSATARPTGAVARPGAARLASAWVPVVLWIGVITWLSGDRFSDEHTASWLTRVPFVAALGLPPAVVDVANVILRKTAHFVEYAALSMLAYRALGISDAARPRRTRLLWAVAVAVTCATLDELHQATTLTRTGSPKDVVLDALGAFAGALSGAAYLYRRRAARRRVP